MKFGIAQPVTRKEDFALLHGAGRYVADFTPKGTLPAVALRSPHEHARFRIPEVAASRGMFGVGQVLSSDDIRDLGPLPCVAVPPDLNVEAPPYLILASEEVRHVGDIVAFVVADTLDQAKDAAEAIAVEWEALPHVVEAVAATEQGAPLVWPQRPGNIAFEMTLGDETKTVATFGTAAKIVSLTVVNQRLVTNYLDTRAVVAEYDDVHDRITLTLGSQGSHIVRDILCDQVLKIPKDKMRVVTPDVGGGFGTKLFPYREYALAAVAAKRLKRAVKWVADRTEHFLGDAQGRDNVSTASLRSPEAPALASMGHHLHMGAYLSCFAPYIPYVGVVLPASTTFRICFIRIRAAFTNTVPVDAHAAPGDRRRPMRDERLVDAAAHDLDMAPDTRKKELLIKPKAMPHRRQRERLTIPRISPSTGAGATH
jgi:carbon-monoxide dehydrogenase large subunit